MNSSNAFIDSADIRKVDLYKVSPTGVSGQECYFLHQKDIDAFIQAQERLHVSPGVNPHSGVQTHRLVAVKVSRLNPDRNTSYWWCSPDLNSEGGPVLLGWESVFSTDYSSAGEDEEYEDLSETLH